MGLSDAEVDFGVAVDEVRGVGLLPPHCNGVGGSGWLGTRSTAVSCISYPDAKRAVVHLPLLERSVRTTGSDTGTN